MLYIAILFLVCSVSFIYALLIEMPFLAVDKFLMSFLSQSHQTTNKVMENPNQLHAYKNKNKVMEHPNDLQLVKKDAEREKNDKVFL